MQPVLLSYDIEIGMLSLLCFLSNIAIPVIFSVVKNDFTLALQGFYLFPYFFISIFNLLHQTIRVLKTSKLYKVEVVRFKFFLNKNLIC